jgi:hypothetical protein
MADREDKFVHPGPPHLAQQDFENGHIADRHERLGDNFGIRGQTAAFAPGEYDSFHNKMASILMAKILKIFKHEGHKGTQRRSFFGSPKSPDFGAKSAFSESEVS